MTCYYPVNQYISIKHPLTDKGKTNYVYNTRDGHYHTQSQRQCGQCWGCRLERSRMWAIRCMHELKLYEEKGLPSQFLTLTYDDNHLPNNSTLHKPDLQKFWKRLRKKHKIRYYACGEYGEKCIHCGQSEYKCHCQVFKPSLGRPHYHAIVFGLPVHDKTYDSIHNGNTLYKSKEIQKIWQNGNVLIGSVTFDSCAYVARYIMKKINGKQKEFHYEKINYQTGEVLGPLEPEFTNMSRNPGISTEFYNKYKSDIYQAGTDGTVIIRGGIKCQPPKFYEDKFEIENPDRMVTIKDLRKVYAEGQKANNTRERLITREKLKLTIINKKLPRQLQE